MMRCGKLGFSLDSSACRVMAWWKISDIDYNNENFSLIIFKLVISCPSTVRQTKKVKRQSDGIQYNEVYYKDVSARNSSFRRKSITGSLLTTILSQIRRPLVANNSYAVLKTEYSIEEEVKNIEAKTNLSDKFFELMVYHTRSDMPDSEAIYYYIRNSFAHGSFEIIENRGSRIYLLESKKDKTIHAQMRLKEETLLSYARFTDLSPNDVRGLQRKKRKQ